MYDYTNKQKNMKHELNMLLSKTLTMFRYEGLPETIPQRELERQLQTGGYAFITKVKGELYSFTGGLGGEPDVYGNPTQIVIANPALDYNATLDIKKDGVLVRSDTMENGLSHLLAKYATMMNESEITMVVNSFNARFPVLLSAGDDKTKESAEAYLKQIQAGELGVIAENRLFEGINLQTAGGQGSMFTQLIEYQQYLKATLYNELGLEMNNNMKRERLTEDEVNMTDIIYPFVDNMLTNREEALELINEKYGTEITVGFDSVWAKHAPSDAWDDEAFYDELDMHLEMLMGSMEQEQAQMPMPVEEELPELTEDELLEILAQLEALSEEVNNGNNSSEHADSEADSGRSDTTSDGGLGEREESPTDIEPSGKPRGDDNGPEHDNTGPSDGAGSRGTGLDAGTEDTGTDTTRSTDAKSDEPDVASSTTDDVTDETDATGEPSGVEDATSTSTDEPDGTPGEHNTGLHAIGRRSVATEDGQQPNITINIGDTGNADSGARSEVEVLDAKTTHDGDETGTPGEGTGTGGTPVNVTVNIHEEVNDEEVTENSNTDGPRVDVIGITDEIVVVGVRDGDYEEQELTVIERDLEEDEEVES